MSKRIIFTVLGLSCAWTSLAVAQDVRYYDQDGVTYRETRHVVQRPVSATEIQQREQVVYRQQVTTESHEQVRTVQTPVVEYQWVPRLHGRWNPFTQPYVVHEQVPVTHWETHTEIVTVPVTRSEWVPETRVVDVPIVTQRMANEEVISRVAVGPSPSTGSTVAGGVSIGGVARLDNDPPRGTTLLQPAGTLR